MNTTVLFVELLIIGFQGGIWILFLILSVFGYKWLLGLQSTGISDWQTLITIFLLSMLYVLGIIIDRTADAIFSGWSKRIKKRVFPDSDAPTSAIRFGFTNEYLNRQIEYTRTRMRIARASSVNFALTTIFAVVFIATQLQGISDTERLRYLAFTLIFGIALAITAIVIWKSLTRGYYETVKKNVPMPSLRSSRKTKRIVNKQ